MKIVWITLMLLYTVNLNGMDITMLKNDTTDNGAIKKDPEVFYDSLEVKANRHRITKWLYDYMITSTNDSIIKDLRSYEYYRSFKNKTIGSISIKSLEVFGPDFYDTLKTTNIWAEKMANKMHSKSNLNVIRKNLWIKEGQVLDPELIMDNERLLRSLPYLKDVRIIIKPRIGNNKIVDILILTKDVFSFGLAGSIGNINKGEVGVYDKNIFGIGHEIRVKFVGHTEKAPRLGMEAYYAVNNLKGNFINFSAGYANNYIREDFFISFERDFLRPRSVYAGGITALRSFRSNTINLNDNVTSDFDLNYILLDGWYGRRLKLGINPNDSRFQMTLAGRVRYTSFYDRPLPDIDNNQFFANSTFYLGSLSFSHRTYVRDYLVYSYGIIEDIPKGYLHELVFGYDHNEFGNRWYSHLFLSTGNLFKQKPYYLYTSMGIGSFWRHSGLEQGMFDLKVNFISPLFYIWNIQVRQFIKLNYTLGINRFEIEDLFLRNAIGIRGFGSRIEKGKQRLTLNVENVFFQKKSILNFQSAFFSFLDMGIVGPANQSIFKQNYFAGIGVGLRIRNENLIFKTIQLRLAFYPNHPSDVNSIGFILDEVPRSRFYSFQPRGPEPLRFE
jgi:hypothetical protein